jgi:hypothetical protein
MKKIIQKHIIRPVNNAKVKVHQQMAPAHQYFYEKWAWYRWWHEQDYHRQVHYVAMMVGIIAAIYFVMIDTILTEVTYR